jgi:hypothetical protein
MPGALHGDHRFLNSFFAIVGFFGANLFGCNLYPRRLLANDAPQSIARVFTVALAVWLAAFLLYVIHRTIPFTVASVILFAVVFWWCWKRVSKWFWKTYHRSMGFADIERVQDWSAEDFDREYAYFHKLFDLATDATQKKRRSMDIFALLDVARHSGFVLTREGENFDTLHFVKAKENGSTSTPELKNEDIPF